MQKISVLASDMDGTFIPLDGSSENVDDLVLLTEQLRSSDIELIYVTGRNFDLVVDAIDSHSLPAPKWLICDVGTSLYRAEEHGYASVQEYSQTLAARLGDFGVERLKESLTEIAGLRLQEPHKQGPFKLSYYCDQDRLQDLRHQLESILATLSAPYRLIASVDPFNQDGLIDFLPTGVSKDFALRWWIQHRGKDLESVVFAGDSGNDVAALTAGYRSIVVGNAEQHVKDQVRETHRQHDWTGRLYVATSAATSGVLEGLNHFLSTASST